MLRRWLYRTRLHLGHTLTAPLHQLFNRFPGYELGLDLFHVSRIECWHAPLAGCRAVQISDLHLDRYLPRHDRAAGLIRELAPNWIFVTGDLLNVPSGLPHAFRFLARLREVAPVYITLGNHDHYSGVTVDRFIELADRHKVTLLINQTIFYPLESGELAVVGLDDPTTDRADLSCIPASAPNRFTVLLAHAPMLLDHLDARHSVHLVLCGHSHGGQWRFPGVKPFWLPPGCKGRVHGEYNRNGHRLYVNKGLGWSALPVRINCRPEILIVDWTNDDSPEMSPPG